MAGKIYVGSQKVPGGPTPLIPAGNANNIQPPQANQHNPVSSGPQHIPQAPFPMPRIPIKLPWGPGSTGIGL